MKPHEIKQKARAKAAAMQPVTRQYEFTDLDGKPGSCTVTIPAERFSYGISRKVAENLLTKHGSEKLPFDLMRPIGLHEDDDWREVTEKDFIEPGILPKHLNVFEIWLRFGDDDIPAQLFNKLGK